jgi:Protein of unknown function (DUF2924)
MARRPNQSLAEVEIASLRGLDQQALTVIWRRLQRQGVPPVFAGDLLVRVLAHDLQVARFGDLSMVARQRLKAAAKEAPDACGPSGSPGSREAAGSSEVSGVFRSSRALSPGTRLLRDWQGETWRSLSTIARRITGTSWNGWTFFGVDRSAGGVKPERAGRSEQGARPAQGESSGRGEKPSQTQLAGFVSPRGSAHA